MTVYIAAPFFTDEQLQFVKYIEDELDKNGIPYYSPRSEGVLIHQSEEKKMRNKRDIYLKNIYHIKDCILMIAVIDDRDTGTIWEMGYAAALKKDIISISNKSYGLNIMIAESVRAHVLTIKDMKKAILDRRFKGEIIRDVH